MLTFRRTPATSTLASRLASSTTSMIWPGIARHTWDLSQVSSKVRQAPAGGRAPDWLGYITFCPDALVRLNR